MVNNMKKYWDGENWLVVEKCKYMKKYYLGNKLHRKNGPAIIWYYKNRQIFKKIYFKNGKYHREDIPAIIHYDKNGNISEERYYFNGNEINQEDINFYFPVDSKEKKFLFNLKYGE